MAFQMTETKKKWGMLIVLIAVLGFNLSAPIGRPSESVDLASSQSGRLSNRSTVNTTDDGGGGDDTTADDDEGADVDEESPTTASDARIQILEDRSARSRSGRTQTTRFTRSSDVTGASSTTASARSRRVHHQEVSDNGEVVDVDYIIDSGRNEVRIRHSSQLEGKDCGSGECMTDRVLKVEGLDLLGATAQQLEGLRRRTARGELPRSRSVRDARPRQDDDQRDRERRVSRRRDSTWDPSDRLAAISKKCKPKSRSRSDSAASCLAGGLLRELDRRDSDVSADEAGRFFDREVVPAARRLMRNFEPGNTAYQELGDLLQDLAAGLPGGDEFQDLRKKVKQLAAKAVEENSLKIRKDRLEAEKAAALAKLYQKEAETRQRTNPRDTWAIQEALQNALEAQATANALRSQVYSESLWLQNSLVPSYRSNLYMGFQDALTDGLIVPTFGTSLLNSYDTLTGQYLRQLNSPFTTQELAVVLPGTTAVLPGTSSIAIGSGVTNFAPAAVQGARGPVIVPLQRPQVPATILPR